MEFKVGDIVARKSYNYDVLFKITNIRGEMYDLIGITVRIIAASIVLPIDEFSDSKTSISHHAKSRNNICKPPYL